MLDLLVWAFWFTFGAYSFWFFTKAKTLQPLTLSQLALSWKLHKKETGCKASRIDNLLMRDDEVVGFKCGCGYEFLQKRLITQKVPHAQTTIFELAEKMSGPPQDSSLDWRTHVKI